jgi:hypothetical protein
MLDDFNFIRKKVESLIVSVNSIKTEEGHSGKSSAESSHFVDKLFFNDYVATQKKEIELMKEGIRKEINTLSAEVSSELKQFIKEKDLKILEDFLLQKVEEIRQHSLKKFADKNDTAKNVKYLDTQIKQIVDIYIKKSEKGDNWLLAKKPVGGFSCASCERYLGDLHDNTEYLPWNKVSPKNADQRLYRVIFINFRQEMASPEFST